MAVTACTVEERSSPRGTRAGKTRSESLGSCRRLEWFRARNCKSAWVRRRSCTSMGDTSPVVMGRSARCKRRVVCGGQRMAGEQRVSRLGGAKAWGLLRAMRRAVQRSDGRWVGRPMGRSAWGRSGTCVSVGRVGRVGRPVGRLVGRPGGRAAWRSGGWTLSRAAGRSDRCSVGRALGAVGRSQSKTGVWYRHRGRSLESAPRARIRVLMALSAALGSAWSPAQAARG